MNESQAKAALRAQGIANPSKSLIENWLRVQQYEETAGPPPALEETVGDTQPCVSPSVSLEESPSVGRPSSESNLEPLLRDRGELERPAGRRKAGRPRVQAPWFQAVAATMGDGTPLREALRLCGISGLSVRQLRALYRNRAFQALYKEARRKFLSDYGRRSSQALRKMRQYAGL